MSEPARKPFPKWLGIVLGLGTLALITVDHRFVRGTQGTIILVGCWTLIAVAVFIDRWRRS